MKVRISIDLPLDLLEGVQRVCAERGVSRNHLVTEALEVYLGQEHARRQATPRIIEPVFLVSVPIGGDYDPDAAAYIARESGTHTLGFRSQGEAELIAARFAASVREAFIVEGFDTPQGWASGYERITFSQGVAVVCRHDRRHVLETILELH